MKSVFFTTIVFLQILWVGLCSDNEFEHREVVNEIDSENVQKIVGGEEVQEGRYPYMVALMDCNDRQFCGGSLISEDWVLSAAHCKGVATHVYIGRHDLSDETEEYESIEVDLEIKHPLYFEAFTEKDYLLIKLKRPSAFTPVKLDSGTATLTHGTPVTVMGWGLIIPETTFLPGVETSVLREVEVNVVANTICFFSYGFITPNMLCAKKLGKDSCQGDSGGPLIIKGDSADRDVQVGIVSFGSGCANPLFPGVYARVSNQIEWITSTSGTAISNMKRLRYRFLSWMNKNDGHEP